MDWTMHDQAESPVADRELVPEGEHLFEIRSASEGKHKFKEGDFLMLRLAAASGAYQFLFCDIPAGPAGAKLARSLADALGDQGGPNVSISASALEGRQVRAEVYHRISANGKTYVNVSRFVAAEPLTKPVKVRNKADATARAAAPDDIPF
jgi:hypothetical protein